MRESWQLCSQRQDDTADPEVDFNLWYRARLAKGALRVTLEIAHALEASLPLISANAVMSCPEVQYDATGKGPATRDYVVSRVLL